MYMGWPDLPLVIRKHLHVYTYCLNMLSPCKHRALEKYTSWDLNPLVCAPCQKHKKRAPVSRGSF